MISRRLQDVLVHIVVILAAVVVGASVVGRMENAGIAVLAVAAAGLCIAYPNFSVAALVGSAFSVEWMMGTGYAPRSAQLLQDVLALAIIAVIIVRIRRRGGRAFAMPGGRWLLVFVACGLAGAIVAGQHPVSAVLGFRSQLTFVPLALAPYGLAYDKNQLKRLLGLILTLSLLQVPVAVFQFVFLRQGSSGDVVGGTLGVYSSGVLTVLMIAIATVFVGLLLYVHNNRARIALALVVCMIPPALNETKVFFVAAPVILSAMFLPRIRRNAFGALIVVILLISSLTMVVQSYQSLYGGTFAGRNVVDALVLQETGEQMAEGGVMKRLPSVVFAFSEVTRDIGTTLFGHGAGSLTRSDVVGRQGPLLELYGAALRNTVWLTRLVLEYGLVGFLAFFALLVAVFGAGRRVEQTSQEPLWQAFGVGLQGVVITMALLSVYTGTFTTDALACVFWAFGGIAGQLLALSGSETRSEPFGLLEG